MYFRMMPFLCIHILPGSVATCLKHCGIFKHQFVAKLLPSRLVKKFWKSVNIWWSYGQELGVLFFDSRCRCKAKPDCSPPGYPSNRLFIIFIKLARLRPPNQVFCLPAPCIAIALLVVCRRRRPSECHANYRVWIGCRFCHGNVPWGIEKSYFRSLEISPPSGWTKMCRNLKQCTVAVNVNSWNLKSPCLDHCKYCICQRHCTFGRNYKPKAIIRKLIWTRFGW